jgi:hypothetical protein
MNPTSGIISNTFNRASPGRVRVKTCVDVVNAVSYFTLSYSNFSAWCGQARNILTPFQYFRVVEFTSTVIVSGGAVSPYSVAFNLSNSNSHDTSTAGILDDDYSAYANALVQPLLQVPRSYLLDGARTWYNATDADPPSVIDRVQATMGYSGSGGDEVTDIIAIAVVEMVIEFHTMV